MISIVICSIDEAKLAAASEMYRRLLPGAEFVTIRDAKSLAEGYNRGIARSAGDLLVLSHDDVEILNSDLEQKLIGHLANFDLVGVAGTSKLVAPGWMAAGPPFIFGQVVHPNKPRSRYRLEIYGAPRPIVGGIQALDGLFLAMNRTVFDKVQFDAAMFDDFFLYDIDFSYSAYLAGMKLGVACDIQIIHNSAGNFGAKWEEHAMRFYRKCAGKLEPVVRQFAPAWIAINEKRELVERMTPGYWE